MARETSLNDFGLLIAYVIPGLTALWGASYLSGPLRAWVASPPAAAQSIGGFLYLTVASVGAGVTVSTARWLLIDTAHHATGLRPPHWDFARLGQNAAAFDTVVEHYYRYYQFQANTLVSLLLVFAARRWSLGLLSAPFGPADLGLLALAAVLLAGSRDSLRRYYTRGGQLLRESPRPRRGRRSGSPREG
jgi:hypothetical protein